MRDRLLISATVIASLIWLALVLVVSHIFRWGPFAVVGPLNASYLVLVVAVLPAIGAGSMMRPIVARFLFALVQVVLIIGAIPLKWFMFGLDGRAPQVTLVASATYVLGFVSLTGYLTRFTHEHARGRCRNCGYDLRGLPERRCPECGRPF